MSDQPPGGGKLDPDIVFRPLRVAVLKTLSPVLPGLSACRRRSHQPKL